MKTLFDWLNSLPSTAVPALGTIIAAVISIVSGTAGALIGGFVANRGHNLRLEKQLRYDATQRNRDREMSLRKDIYFSAAEAISAGITCIGSFANIDIPNDKLMATYLEKSPSIAKVHIIAGEETTQAVAHLLTELNAAYIQLFTKRIPLVAQKNRLTILEQQIGDFAKERDRMIELMKQCNLDGVADQRLWEVLQNNFEFEQKRVDETLKEQSNLAADFLVKQLDYLQECATITSRLNRLTLPALLAVRTELDLPINEIAYRQIFEENYKKGEGYLREFLQNTQQFATAHPSASEDE